MKKGPQQFKYHRPRPASAHFAALGDSCWAPTQAQVGVW